LRANAETLDEQLQTLRVQARVAEGKINEQMQELANRSNTIQILSGHNQKLQNRVTDLETLVSMTSRDTGTDFRAFFNHYSEVKSAHGEMASKLKSEKEMRLALNERLTEMQSENGSLTTVINELQEETSSLEVCQPQTLRALLTLRLVEQTWNVQPNDGTFEEPNQAQNWLPSGLSQNSFDEICSPAEIQGLANTFPKGRSYNQFYQRLRLTVCTTCSKAKFSFKVNACPSFNSMKWLNEYVGKTRYFSCCHEEVCKECFKKHLLATLETKWWYKLGTLQWFLCPRDGCENALGIRCEADLETCLEQFCWTEAEQHVKT
jgi:archaellum component FlaC